MSRLLTLLLVLTVAGCAARRPAPVDDRAAVPPQPPVVAEAPRPPPEPPAPKPLPTHVVKRGETLVGIALQYGLDYRELAAWNNITNPNVLALGQVLLVARPPDAKPYTPPSVATPLASVGPPIEARPLVNTSQAKVEPRAQKLPYSERALAQLGSTEAGTPPSPTPGPPPDATPVPAPPPAPPVAVAEPDKAGTDREVVDWMWPVKGKVLAGFTEQNKGIDIGGKKGTPVVAAASGRVIYANDGLRGYGKLVIIKHNETWFSAYAHNDNILVKEQQDVRRGQRIAEMGSTDAGQQVKLHFEVRRHGRPVDPTKVLPPM